MLTLQHGEGDQQVGQQSEEKEGDVSRFAPACVHNLEHRVSLRRLVLQLQSNHCTQDSPLPPESKAKIYMSG